MAQYHIHLKCTRLEPSSFYCMIIINGAQGLPMHCKNKQRSAIAEKEAAKLVCNKSRIPKSKDYVWCPAGNWKRT